MADSISQLAGELRPRWLEDIEKVAARAVRTVIVQTTPAPPTPLPDLTWVVPQSRVLIAGDGLVGGGDLSNDRTFDVGAGDGIQVLTDSVAVKLHATVSGMVVDANGLRLGTPGTLAYNSTNLVSGASHTHAITTSSNPGAAASILQSDASGFLTLVRLIATGLVSTPQVITASGNLALVPATGITDVADLRATTRLRTPLLDTGSGVVSIAPATHIELNPGSNLVNLKPNKAIQSENYASQTTGMRVTYAGEGDFRYLFADEMHVKVFIADLEQALAGGQIISKSVAVLSRPFTAPSAGGAATLYVWDLPSAENMAVFQSGDIVRLREFNRSGGSLSVTNCWGVVTSYTNLADKEQSWTFTRSSGGNAGAITAGSVIGADSLALDYGTSGNGFYEVNAIDGLYGLNSPYAQIVTWSGHPATGQVVNARYGNLRGIFSVADEFGIYVGGGVTDADAYLRLSNLNARFNNVPIQMWNAGVNTGFWNANGNLALSDVGVGTVGTRVFHFNASTGEMRIGKVGSNVGNLLWSGGSLALRMNTTDMIVFDSSGDSYFAGRMNIGTSGEIVQGSGTLGSVGTWPSPPTLWGTFTGYRVGRSGSVGLWGLYNAGLAQVYATTGGLLGFGGGNGTLDAAGVTLLGYSYIPASPWPPTGGSWPASDPTRGYKFLSADGHLLGGFTGTFSSAAGNTPLWMTVYLQNATGGDLYQWDFLSSGAFRSPGTVEVAPGGSGTGYQFTLISNTGIYGGSTGLTVEVSSNQVFRSLTSNADSYMRLGIGNTNDRNTYVDFFANGAAPTTQDARIIRNSGANGAFLLANYGTGAFTFQQTNVGAFTWTLNGSEVVRIHTDSRVGIGTNAPDALLDVNGYARALAVIVDGDSGAAASTGSLLALSNVVSTTISTGVGNVRMSGATARTNTAWLKLYFNNAAYYSPLWTTITG